MDLQQSPQRFEFIRSEPPEMDTQAQKAALQREVEEAAREEDEIRKRLECIKQLRDMTAGPVEEKLEDLEERREDIMFRLKELAIQAEEENLEVPPGPAALSWIETIWFHTLCTFVITLNMGTMLQEKMDPHCIVARYLEPLDIGFLTWYSFELLFRIIYHQRTFLIGQASVVCWNYIDAIIVFFGAVEMLAKAITGSGNSSDISALRVLRLLRVFRLLRVLRAVQGLQVILTHSDLSWIDGPKFEGFIGFVIAINVLSMWPELDCSWLGWDWIENTFLVIYGFEVAVKLVVHRGGFFVYWDDEQGSLGSTDTIEGHHHEHHHHRGLKHPNIWNILDLSIVVAGVMDLWMLPLYSNLTFQLTGQNPEVGGDEIILALRLMRILRIFRLVRLVRHIKPLRNLVVGVGDSMAAMFWVAALALMTLYALGIIFTVFAKKEYFEGVKDPHEVETVFDNVPDSMFMLFKLMNDDLSLVSTIGSSQIGRLFFVIAMVLLNWMILATLTSVISGNMIEASQSQQEAERRDLALQKQSEFKQRLKFLFEEIDDDHSGFINEKEWHHMTHDSHMAHEFALVAGIDQKELDELFSTLCNLHDGSDAGRHQHAKLILSYPEMIEAITEGNHAADKRTEHLISRSLQQIDERCEQKMHMMLAGIAACNDKAKDIISAAEQSGAISPRSPRSPTSPRSSRVK